jgi:hypothetical protein
MFIILSNITSIYIRMNSFSGLRQEKTDPDDTIRTDNQLRTQKKKLRNLERKEDTLENLRKRTRIVSAIEEYENKGKSSLGPNNQKKQKHQKKVPDDEELKKAVQEAQTPEYKQAKQDAEDARRRKEDERQSLRATARQEKHEKQQQRQEQLEQEQEQEFKQRWQEWQKWEQKWRQHQQQQRQRRQQGQKGPREDTPEETISDLHEFLKQHNAPEDIISLANDYNKQGYRKLSLKYHSDRPGGTTELSQFLNRVKDHHEPNIHVPDETWVK